MVSTGSQEDCLSSKTCDCSLQSSLNMGWHFHIRRDSFPPTGSSATLLINDVAPMLPCEDPQELVAASELRTPFFHETLLI